MSFTKDELIYLRNLLKVSGDLSCRWRIGEMKRPIKCSDLFQKIDDLLKGIK